VKRRDFITLLGGVAAAWPLAARAQQAAMPVIGYLSAGTPESGSDLTAAFRKGLAEAGYVEGRNLAIEYRWGQNDFGRLPELAADLVRRHVSVIATPGSTQGALAAKAATESIPIVFQNAGDPIQIGLVASLNRPGRNITGINSMNVELMPKRLGLLHELVPKAGRIAVLINPTNAPVAEIELQSIRDAARTLGLQVQVFNASTSREVDTAFAMLAQERMEALVVGNSPIYYERRVQLANLASRYAMPAIYGRREQTEVGGLMSYGTSLTDQSRQVGVYVGRILKGEKPGDLPVMQAAKFEFIINLQSARTIGIEVPPALLSIADDVIE
jgi:putative ABC transport system substrate-binding protein